MNEKPPTITELSKKIEQLEQQHAELLQALKMLLPIALCIPAATSNSAQAVKEMRAALEEIENKHPQPEDFWYLASAMILLLSSKALTQHPNDPEVVEIHHGIRKKH